jgi:hypothetical protein
MLRDLRDMVQEICVNLHFPANQQQAKIPKNTETDFFFVVGWYGISSAIKSSQVRMKLLICMFVCGWIIRSSHLGDMGKFFG